MSDVTVRRDDQAHRYEIRVDGALAGFTAYLDDADDRIFHHTEIDPAFGGRGLSGVLIGDALADVRASGMHVVAVCPLVAAYLTKHGEHQDIRRAVTSEALAEVKAVRG
ncbi:GNAT family N-acetyltransferase [Actinokineospora iranica]|uniref:N-acetyltransferase domain-containing protein n=1 Tax=Actinokineospora iranica TaxID=1271860 RepID=A0A1G6S4K4_9PSEU|nr:GNAT family N-acetyltransferase [Actinokineospora iranica]SDD11769.1 hypothetical protein SAMN05216174_107222 [Actinokineospora iranica]